MTESTADAEIRTETGAPAGSGAGAGAGTALERERRKAAEQLLTRLRYGDQVSELREVDHFAVFRSRRRARSAGRALVEAGYEIALTRLGLRTVLVASHFAAVDEAASTTFLAHVIDAVEEAGGDYDGWRAAIVPAH